MSLRVAYIPEHFSTPLFFAIEKKFFGFDIELVPVIEGSGRLINLLNTDQVDIAIGLTEAFVADIGKGRSEETYKIVDTYVQSPLCWAISTGAKRDELTKASDLKGKKIGVSRIGSGSYVMSFVLGHQQEFPSPFYSDFPILSNFKNLRDSVNQKFSADDELTNSDAFMWEHFTTKKYYDNGEIKRIGEIYTPWPSWVITASKKTLKGDTITKFLSGLNKGIAHFNTHHEDAVKFISENLDYSAADAQEWLRTVKFNTELGEVPLDWENVVVNTSEVLKLAGVLNDDEDVIEKRLVEGVHK